MLLPEPTSPDGPQDELRPMDERLFALSQIVYEIDTMTTATLRYRALDRAGGLRVERNIYLEAALLHARALIEFLVRKPTSDSYMCPADFGPGWDRSNCGSLGRELSPLGAYLAHLTWTRIELGGPRLSDSLIYDVLDALEAFASHLKQLGRLGAQPIADAVTEAKRHADEAGGFTSSSVPAFSTSDSIMMSGGGGRPLELDLQVGVAP